MAKYDPLRTYLKEHSGDRITLSFGEVESILGAKLPASAHTHRAWWANQSTKGHPESDAWMNGGWEVEEVSLAASTVVFCRAASR